MLLHTDKALCPHVHFVDPRVSGYLVRQGGLLCIWRVSSAVIAAGLHAPRGVGMTCEWTGPVTRGLFGIVGWVALSARYPTTNLHLYLYVHLADKLWPGEHWYVSARADLQIPMHISTRSGTDSWVIACVGRVPCCCRYQSVATSIHAASIPGTFRQSLVNSLSL